MPKLRVLSYNVRYFGHATRGLASTKKAMQRIADAIAALHPMADILCLQEVESSSIRSTLAHRKKHPDETQLARFMEMLRASVAAAGKKDAYEAYYFPAHAYRLAAKTHFYTTGLAVLAHRDLVIDHHNAASPADITDRHLHPIRSLKQTRICAHVRFRHRSGHSIDVFNTHLSLPSTMAREFWTGTARMGFGKNQLAEARNLAAFVESQRASDRFIIAGDFNALPGSPVYQHLVSEVGYQDALCTAWKMDPEQLNAWPTAGFARLRMHLDHVLSGRALEWLEFAETRSFGDKTAPFHGLSDHMPMIGTCRVRD